MESPETIPAIKSMKQKTAPEKVRRHKEKHKNDRGHGTEMVPCPLLCQMLIISLKIGV